MIIKDSVAGFWGNFNQSDLKYPIMNLRIETSILELKVTQKRLRKLTAGTLK
ncbi:hypothetical protein FC51_GL002333 [Lentilactobacillus parabuchneri DSM 5707 = NBRC 107865]|uniref:Uncharacterized protein n=1 Tax=Lentilactobacillus parabuchneri DSM 5707 = NBRC 107865 TaxID=1423784 RepID=A0A0R1Z5F3_9LACO|nr:hypothetical protein FC51_GL002333 [Lentilactobacillus parabuchneri DSM 5707 = NBRC 107865]KRN72942.1 hypothetical protein IV42_GL001421 [Lentilactobacillus parabuchneri]